MVCVLRERIYVNVFIYAFVFLYPYMYAYVCVRNYQGEQALRCAAVCVFLRHDVRDLCVRVCAHTHNYGAVVCILFDARRYTLSACLYMMHMVQYVHIYTTCIHVLHICRHVKTHKYSYMCKYINIYAGARKDSTGDRTAMRKTRARLLGVH